MITSTDPAIQMLLDRESIRDALFRYARGIDRREPDLIRSMFWPDAKFDYGLFVGTGEEFVNFTNGTLSEMEQTQHFYGNILIDLDGDKAYVETYFQAYHRLHHSAVSPAGATGLWDLLVGGRYIDRFDKRAGDWRVGDRVLSWDWWREYPDSYDYAKGFLGYATPETGKREGNDAVVTRFPPLLRPR